MGVTQIADQMMSAIGKPGSLSPEQQKIINDAKSAGVDSKQVAGMVAQMSMDNLKSLNDMFSNLLKKMGEMAQSIVNNIR